MNDHYSDTFKSIIPEAPSSDGWADGARRKRRNRGRAMAGVAAAAAIALVVPLSLTMGGNATLIATPGKSETPSPQVAGPSPDPATDAPGAAACWEAPMQARQATPEGATDGAVRAWLCGDADVSGIALGTIGPLEPLVEGVDQIIDFIQSQQTLDESGLNVCTEEYTLAYRVVLDYGDGTSHVVPGELHGCKTIDDGPTVRTGGQELYDLALDLWREQREETGDGDGAFLAPDCPPQTEALQNLLPVEIVTGFTCVLQGEGGFVTGTLNQLPDDLVDAIRMGISADSKPGQGEDGSDYFVTMTGAWGDSLLLRRLDDGVLAWTGSDGPMLWAPPADVLAQLDALARSGSNGSVGGPEPSEPTSVAQPEGCEGVVPRDRRATESEVRELPDSTERIWLCDGGVTMEGGSGVPFEPLVADDLVAEAVEAFNSLSPAEPDRVCTLDAGPSYIVVYEDSDGGRQEAGLELFGCGEVFVGDQVRVGADSYFNTLVSLWQEQRRVDPPAQSRPGPLCPQASSMFNFDPRVEEFVSGVACTGWEYGDEGPWTGEEIPLPNDLLAMVTKQLGTATEAVDRTVLLSGDNIILLTTAGDPVTLAGIEEGAFLISGAAEEWTWTPTGAVADQLGELFAN